MLLGHLAGCTVIWSFMDLSGQYRIKALVLCDEMVAFRRRPEWSQEECRKYGASTGGDETLSLAAAVAWPDGEQVLRGFWPKSSVRIFRVATWPR